MFNNSTFLGLDVHKDTIAVAIARQDKVPEQIGIIPNDPDSIFKMVRRYGPFKDLRVCYEAGPCGYVVYRQLSKLEIDCQVVAPSLIPRKPGDRVKTDKRDATKLARLLRSGDLTAVWVPDESHEALRDLTRGIRSSQADLHRIRQRILKMLLRQGIHLPTDTKNWTVRFREWLNSVHFDFDCQEAIYREMLLQLDQEIARRKRLENELTEAVPHSPFKATIEAWQCMRGIALISATALAAELGDVRRFDKATQLMSYVGLVPCEYSSGPIQRRGHLTKTGNSYLRHILIQAAWHYRHSPSISAKLRKRQQDQPEIVKEIAWKAQQRLNLRFRRLVAKGKPRPKAIVAVAREMLGFIWDIARNVSVP